jgi:hypothetical protein
MAPRTEEAAPSAKSVGIRAFHRHEWNEEATMARFVEVANVEDGPPGTAAIARVGDIEIVVVNVPGTFFAIDNECTHSLMRRLRDLAALGAFAAAAVGSFVGPWPTS